MRITHITGALIILWLVLIILKLVGVVTFNWWWVNLPVFILITGIIGFYIIRLIVTAIWATVEVFEH